MQNNPKDNSRPTSVMMMWTNLTIHYIFNQKNSTFCSDKTIKSKSASGNSLQKGVLSGITNVGFKLLNVEIYIIEWPTIKDELLYAWMKYIWIELHRPCSPKHAKHCKGWKWQFSSSCKLECVHSQKHHFSATSI